MIRIFRVSIDLLIQLKKKGCVWLKSATFYFQKDNVIDKAFWDGMGVMTIRIPARETEMKLF